MNRPIFNQTDVQKSDSNYRNRRHGLCSAEEIVTLILRRYGLEEEFDNVTTDESLERPSEIPAVSVVAPEPVSMQQQSFCWD